MGLTRREYTCTQCDHGAVYPGALRSSEWSGESGVGYECPECGGDATTELIENF